MKQGKTLYNDDKALTDTEVAEEVRDESVTTFEVTEGNITKVKITVKTGEDVVTDADAANGSSDGEKTEETGVATATDAEKKLSVEEQIDLLEAAEDLTKVKVSALEVGGYCWIGGYWNRYGSGYAGNYHASEYSDTAAKSGDWTGCDSYEDKGGIEGMRVYCGKASLNGFRNSSAQFKIEEATNPDTAMVLEWGNRTWDSSKVDASIYKVHKVRAGHT